MVPSYSTGGTFQAPNANPQMPMRSGGADPFQQFLQQLMSNPQFLQSVMPQLQGGMQGMMNRNPSPMGVGQGSRGMLSPQARMGGGMTSMQPSNPGFIGGMQPGEGRPAMPGLLGGNTLPNMGGYKMPPAQDFWIPDNIATTGQEAFNPHYKGRKPANDPYFQQNPYGGMEVPQQSSGGITRKGSGAFQGGQQIGHYGNNNELIRNSSSMVPSNPQITMGSNFFQNEGRAPGPTSMAPSATTSRGTFTSPQGSGHFTSGMSMQQPANPIRKPLGM